MTVVAAKPFDVTVAPPYGLRKEYRASVLLGDIHFGYGRTQWEAERELMAFIVKRGVLWDDEPYTEDRHSVARGCARCGYATRGGNVSEYVGPHGRWVEGK